MGDIWRQVSRFISSSKLWNWFAFVSLLVGLGVLAMILSLPERDFVFVQLPWEMEQFCEQPVKPPAMGPDQFRIYVSGDFVGHKLCMRLSQIPELGRRYRSVRTEWSLDAEVQSRLIFEQHFAMLQLRPETAQETGGSFSEDYRRISYYAPYKVFLIAREAAPTLSGEYLKARKIGLLKNTKSRSGYRVAMRVFRDLGLDLQKLQLEHFSNPEELRLALEKGDVDVISSYWGFPQKTRFPNWHLLEIGGVKGGLNWFLAKDIFADRHQRCAVINALEDLEDGSGDPYFAELSFTPDAKKDCDER